MKNILLYVAVVAAVATAMMTLSSVNHALIPSAAAMTCPNPSC